MTIYMAVCTENGAQVARFNETDHSFFAGYDFMGSVNWTNDSSEAALMSLDEAEQIANDLTAGE